MIREIQLSKKEYVVDLFLLLTYSLLPGIYKVVDNQLFMLFSLPIIIYLLCKHRTKNFFTPHRCYISILHTLYSYTMHCAILLS